MFADLTALFDFVLPDIPTAYLYIPWPQVFAFVTVIVFVCEFFRLMRAILCKIL